MGYTEHNTLILLILLSSVILATSACGIVLLRRYNQQRNRSCLYASLVMFSQVCGILTIITEALSTSKIYEYIADILSPGHLISPFIAYLPVLMYLYEIKRPKELNWKKALIYTSPIPILCLVEALLYKKHFVELYSFTDIIDNIGNPEVLNRVLLSLLYIVYAFAIIAVRPNPGKSGLTRKMALALHALTSIIPFTFLLSFNLNVSPAVFIHFAIIMSLDAFIAYIELAYRIPADVEAIPEEPTKQKGKTHPYFDNPQIWMNPDITATELASIMGTNQKYLSEQIKACGYAGFPDMINHKRVEYICDKLSDQGKEGRRDITQLMYDAGFRSRSNATSEFKRIVGVTPSEYLKNLK